MVIINILNKLKRRKKMINTKFKNESIENTIKSFYSKADSLCSYLKHLIWTTFSHVVLKKKKCYYPVQITPESVSRITGICKYRELTARS